MKRSTLMTTGATLFVGSAVLLLGMKAGELGATRTVEANGEGTVVVQPDSARLYLGVTTTGKTPGEAREKNAAQVGALRDALLALNLSDIKSKTLDVTLSRVYGEPDEKDAPPPHIGFEVRHSLTVLIKEGDLDGLNRAVGRAIDTALESGATTDQSISYFKEDTLELARKARSLAVEDALANARAYAEGANLKVTNVVLIEGRGVDAGSSHFGGQQGGFRRSRPGETSVLTGMSEIRCIVRVTCELLAE